MTGGAGLDEFIVTWSWLIAKGGLALVLTALAVVLFSAKFRRKFWWVLLALVSFVWTVSTGREVMFLAVPLGATYVLLFALFGPRPDDAPPARS
ncbi:hypothetical protein [Caulobacter sp. 17J65-9]|uniref:hypothetical protein n=1 Tax=Caulobacter sp. 17J65-9 TaxID=2709382 RepID=UPI0013CA2AE4|nr:hypothetical protein [Caulobacter sp. 17J65-9]NEX94235.1 hypothetical protein [Caulobacter sp. 17J65-9]